MNAMISAAGRFLSIFAIAWVTATAAHAEPGTASLSLRVENVSAKGGVMRLGLFTEDTYYRSGTAKPVASLDLPASGPAQQFEFTDLAPGVYAIQVLQDLNGNGRMDFNWAGLPTEPYGFSRDAKAFIARPPFAQVKIKLSEGKNAETIHLQNSDKGRRPPKLATLNP
jgi:uncharacterized protein (DUF2141 family)